MSEREELINTLKAITEKCPEGYARQFCRIEIYAEFADKLISALIDHQEPTEPVAWLHEVTDGDEQSLALSFSPDSFPLDTLTGWKSISHRPLIYGDTAPASGVREGMMLDALQRAQRVMHGEGVEDQGEAWDKCAQILDEAITRAADQVNAEGRAPNVPSQLSGKGDGTPSGSKKETTLNGSAPAPSAPHSASQPDTVAVPIQTLHVSLQVLTFLKAVLIGQGYQKDSSSIHQLEIAYSMLRAAQEAK